MRQNRSVVGFYYLLLFFSTLLQRVGAQVGPDISNPPYNGTVTPGDHVEIDFQYQNVGTGNYTVDIAIWNDASATQLIQNITTNREVPSGNSTGVQLDFTYNSSYTWNVPGGLTYTNPNNSSDVTPVEIFYLTVTAVADTTYLQDIRLCSRPIMLHYNAAAGLAPLHIFGLVAIALPVLLINTLF